MIRTVNYERFFKNLLKKQSITKLFANLCKIQASTVPQKGRLIPYIRGKSALNELGIWKSQKYQFIMDFNTLYEEIINGILVNSISLNLSQYRQVVSGLNRIIYEVRQDTIYIHIIVDSRRDMNALLTRRLLRVS